MMLAFAKKTKMYFNIVRVRPHTHIHAGASDVSLGIYKEMRGVQRMYISSDYSHVGVGAIPTSLLSSPTQRVINFL